MANIGDLFKTGQPAPVSGDYDYVRHVGVSCGTTPAQRKIPLAKGNPFPPHAGCHGAVIWKLVRFE